MKNNRMAFIDYAKGFAIICVIWGHILGKLVEAEGFNTVSSINVLFKIVYSFHMPLFFFVSGMLIDSHIKRSFFQGIKNKFLRLIIPYFIWTLIFVLFKNITSTYQSNNTDWYVLLRSPIDPNPLQFWFLYVLFFVYLLYSLFILFFKNQIRVKVIILIISIIFVIINPFISNIWISNYLFKNLIYFAVGAILIEFPKKNRIRECVILLFLFVLFEILYFMFAYSESILKSYIVVFCGLFGSISICYIFNYIETKNIHNQILNWLGFNGVKSMEIYCIHPIIAAVIRIALSIIPIMKNDIFNLLIILVLTVMICDFISYIFNKSAPYKWLFGEYKNKKACHHGKQKFVK